MVTVASYKQHLAVESLTYVELLKKDGMKEEADIFAPILVFALSSNGYKTIGYEFRIYDKTDFNSIISHVRCIDIDNIPHCVCGECVRRWCCTGKLILCVFREALGRLTVVTRKL